MKRLNILNKLTILLDEKQDNVQDYILGSLNKDSENIYSYIVYCNRKDNKPGYTVQLNISQTSAYNTLYSLNIAQCIAKAITNYEHTGFIASNGVITYGQPPIELMLELYEPLIQKMSKQTCDDWPGLLEFADVAQTCCETMLKLYRNGYYIHRRLVARSLYNAVLMQLRKNRNKPETVSFDDIAYRSNEENLTYKDMIPDLRHILDEERSEELEVTLQVFNRVKKFVVKLIGERQFEQLLHAYDSYQTDEWSRKKMWWLRNELEARGLTLDDFKRIR